MIVDVEAALFAWRLLAYRITSLRSDPAIPD